MDIVRLEEQVKKSKEDSNLVSYKISVKADDLTKALNPDIWPLRVKVREFIYYKRNPQKKIQPAQGQYFHNGGGAPTKVCIPSLRNGIKYGEGVEYEEESEHGDTDEETVDS